MNIPDLTTFEDYCEYLKTTIRLNQSTRGYQGQLAKAASCQESYFSRVLHGKAQLSLDQAMGLCEFWHFNDEQTEYFLELVVLAKCVYPPLVSRIKQRVQKLKTKSEKQTKAKGASEIVREDAWLYYSQWHWSAIHIIVGISRFQTVEEISKCLTLEPKIVRQTLDALKKQGLVCFRNDRWYILPVHRHLDSDSALNAMNHSNWRYKAIMDAQVPNSNSLHYTGIQSHSRKDWEQLKQLFLKGISNSRNLVKISTPDEEMSCLCVDLFRLT